MKRPRSWKQRERGEGTRLRILAAIGRMKDPTSTDIAKRAGCSESTVQRHLTGLFERDLVAYARKRNNDMFYTNRYEIRVAR